MTKYKFVILLRGLVARGFYFLVLQTFVWVFLKFFNFYLQW
jgi:hypothetical protein